MKTLLTLTALVVGAGALPALRSQSMARVAAGQPGSAAVDEAPAAGVLGRLPIVGRLFDARAEAAQLASTQAAPQAVAAPASQGQTIEVQNPDGSRERYSVVVPAGHEVVWTPGQGIRIRPVASGSFAAPTQIGIQQNPFVDVTSSATSPSYATGTVITGDDFMVRTDPSGSYQVQSSGRVNVQSAPQDVNDAIARVLDARANRRAGAVAQAESGSTDVVVTGAPVAVAGTGRAANSYSVAGTMGGGAPSTAAVEGGFGGEFTNSFPAGESRGSFAVSGFGSRSGGSGGATTFSGAGAPAVAMDGGRTEFSRGGQGWPNGMGEAGSSGNDDAALIHALEQLRDEIRALRKDLEHLDQRSF